jgi:hypothetical protein
VIVSLKAATSGFWGNTVQLGHANQRVDGGSALATAVGARNPHGPISNPPRNTWFILSICCLISSLARLAVLLKHVELQPTGRSFRHSVRTTPASNRTALHQHLKIGITIVIVICSSWLKQL